MTIAMIKNPSALLILPDGVQSHVIDKARSSKMRCTRQAVFKFGGYDIHLHRRDQISAFTLSVEGTPLDE